MSRAGDELAFLSATDLAALVRRKEVSPVELVDLYLERIDRLDGRLRAFITVCPTEAREAARRAERALAAGDPAPLLGVPFAVKDQFDTKGLRTTLGSRILEAFVPDADATVVARLTAAGAILLGKLNLSEFALGGTVHFPFGQPRNPWNLAHHPGGSSGGSGVATAAALAAFTLGEDTGGSIRIPAAWCGTVGLRPTWGLVSRRGTFPASWSMDTAGPLARTVADAGLVLKLIAGQDPREPLTTRRPVPDYPAALTGDIRGLRVGVVRELTEGGGTEPEVRAAVLAAATLLGTLGALIEDVSLPLLPLAGATFMAVCDSEATTRQLGWLKTRPGDYDQGTRRRLLTASLLPTALYHQANRARALIRQQVLDALATHDLLLCPTMHAASPLIEREQDAVTSKDVAARRFFGHRSHTTPASLAGAPAISVPCGFSKAGLPIGLQLVGRPYDEARVLQVAHAYEQATDWHRRRPNPPVGS
jgi:aspartyl-tRNA(Asn)/glutamyl-tRNA(Gln) amidotransferase subunit A